MFLFIDNYDSFSWNLVQAFYALGRKPVVHANDDPRILELATSPELEAVCISPGPSHPRNAGLCLEFLKRLPASVPVLGVCLGHQLLGYFAGAEVSRAPYVMHGKSSDIIHDGAGLFSGLPNPMTVGRYHSLVVQSKEDEPNPRFTVTSRGPEGEVMALRYNDRPWVGIQFHPESILTPNGLQLLGNFPDNVVPSGQKKKRISRILDALAAGQDLTADMAAAGFADIMDGRMTPAQAGCFLMGLRMKGETPLEMAHAVGIALGRANRVEGLEGDCIDVVGTGGDGRNSFNCSTATALTLAGMGYRVVKHGNRAVSSSCGSADALEGLGFPLDVAPEDVRRLLDERNFAFLFAPNFHPSFRNVGPIRRELGKQEDSAILAFPGINSPGYREVAAMAEEIAAGTGGKALICLEQDMAKALGQALALRLGPNAEILCIDRVKVSEGSYLDVGAPVGPALPVVVKTLVLGK